MSGRSWTGRWGVAHRNRQPRGLSAQGPILNRLAGREYRINESRDGEWTVKWLDADGDVVAWFGGDVRLVHLPEIGVKGNSHFPFSDMNHVEIADLVSTFLAEKNLD